MLFLLTAYNNSRKRLQKYELFLIWQNKKCLRRFSCGGEWLYQ